MFKVSFALGLALLPTFLMHPASAQSCRVDVRGNNNQVTCIQNHYTINAAPSSASVKDQSQMSGTPSLWNHNGSIMRLAARGQGRQFFYMAPRQGLRAAGVGQGTLLFTGVSQGGFYHGTAFIFHNGCAPSPYDVSGPIASDSRGVTVTGSAPILDSACNVVSYRRDVLNFSFLGS